MVGVGGNPLVDEDGDEEGKGWSSRSAEEGRRQASASVLVWFPSPSHGHTERTGAPRRRRPIETQQVITSQISWQKLPRASAVLGCFISVQAHPSTPQPLRPNITRPGPASLNYCTNTLKKKILHRSLIKKKNLLQKSNLSPQPQLKKQIFRLL